MTFKSSAIAAVVAVSSFAPVASYADNSANIEIGKLACHQTAQSNYVVYSKAKFSYEFTNTDGETANFTSKIGKVGIDLSTNKGESFVWYVFAPSLEADISGLEGDYVGVSADVSIGAGAGTHVLVGGLDKSFALQPVSFAGQEGIGFAVGVEQLRLKHDN